MGRALSQVLDVANSAPMSRMQLFRRDGAFTVPAGVDKVALSLVGAGGRLYGTSAYTLPAPPNYTGSAFWDDVYGNGLIAFGSSTISYAVHINPNLSATWLNLGGVSSTGFLTSAFTRDRFLKRGSKIFPTCVGCGSGSGANKYPFVSFDLATSQINLGPVLPAANYPTSHMSSKKYRCIDPTTGFGYSVFSGNVYKFSSLENEAPAEILSTAVGIATTAIEARGSNIILMAGGMTLTSTTIGSAGFRVSGNGGATWQTPVFNLNGATFTSSTYQIAYDFSTDWSKMYIILGENGIAGRRYVFLSTDFGLTWNCIFNTSGYGSAGWVDSLNTPATNAHLGFICSNDGSRWFTILNVPSGSSWTTSGASVYLVVGDSSGNILWSKSVFTSIGYIPYKLSENEVELISYSSPTSYNLAYVNLSTYEYRDLGQPISSGSASSYWDVSPTGSVLTANTENATGQACYAISTPGLSLSEGSAVIGSFGTLSVLGGSRSSGTTKAVEKGSGIGPISSMFAAQASGFPVAGRVPTAVNICGVPGIFDAPAAGSGMSALPGAGGIYTTTQWGAGGGEAILRRVMSVTPGETLSIMVGRGAHGSMAGAVVVEY